MSKLKQAMKILQAQGIFAPEKAWKCCLSCGTAEVPEGMAWAFFHEQDKENWKEDGQMCIAFGGGGVRLSDSVALSIVEAFTSVGLYAKWDGNVDRRVEVFKEKPVD